MNNKRLIDMWQEFEREMIENKIPDKEEAKWLFEVKLKSEGIIK